jgi:S1-C subfamily serine protease
LQNLSDDLAATAKTASEAVVRQDESIHLGLPDGRTVPATLVGRDPTTDLAVLRTQALGLTPPAWADIKNLQVGHLVLALGRPGRTIQATLGIVSALGKSWRTPAGGQLDHYLQTDVVRRPKCPACCSS